MMYIARDLEREGYTLRSGNADGADSAFAKGVLKDAQIWLPWKNFNLEETSQRPKHDYRVISEDDIEAFDAVLKFHPNGANLRDSVRRLHARNFRQVIGKDEQDSKFVICWTPDGEEVGGTATAMRIAKHYDIPVFNLFNMSKSDVFKEINKLNLLY